MRRSIRPFTVETKKTSRRGDKIAQPPQAPLFVQPEPVVEVRRHSPQRAAAEALFDKPAAARAQPGAPEAGARILQSLIEPQIFPLYDELLDAPVRRGRKPGSKNKPRENAPTRAIQQKSQPSWADFRLETEERASEPEIAFAFAPTPAPLAAPEPADLTSLRRNGRLARDQLPRGQRWKARLPKFARQSGLIKRDRP